MHEYLKTGDIGRLKEILLIPDLEMDFIEAYTSPFFIKEEVEDVLAMMLTKFGIRAKWPADKAAYWPSEYTEERVDAIARAFASGYYDIGQMRIRAEVQKGAEKADEIVSAQVRWAHDKAIADRRLAVAMAFAEYGVPMIVSVNYTDITINTAAIAAHLRPAYSLVLARLKEMGIEVTEI